MIETRSLQLVTLMRRIQDLMKDLNSTLLICYCAVSIALLLLYSPIVSVSFIGGDDFREIARAHFEDSTNPWLILTTPHDANRFRPLDRATTLVTYEIGGFNPAIFRLRNIFIHIVNSILVGHLIASFLKNRRMGPVAALLFGLSPANALPVSLAVTTKTLFGLAFATVCILWLNVWRKKQIRLLEAIALFVLSSVTMLYHEQGLGLILWPLLLCGAIALYDRKRFIHWCMLGGILTVSIGLVVAMGRISAGVVTSAPSVNSLKNIASNSAFAIVSLFAQIDFLMLFGRFSITRHNIDFLSDPFDHILQLCIYMAGLFLIFGIMLVNLIVNIRMKNSKWIVQTFILLVGLLTTLTPVIVYSKYSELYNYIPSIFSVGLIINVLSLPLSTHKKLFLRHISISLFGLLICVYCASTIYRNVLIRQVAQETSAIVASIPQVVAEPDQGSEFVLINQPQHDDGYSLYGLQGVGTFEEFGVQPAIQMIYNRTDLKATLLSSDNSLTHECMVHGDRTLYILSWNDKTKELSPSLCSLAEP